MTARTIRPRFHERWASRGRSTHPTGRPIPGPVRGASDHGSTKGGPRGDARPTLPGGQSPGQFEGLPATVPGKVGLAGTLDPPYGAANPRASFTRFWPRFHEWWASRGRSTHPTGRPIPVPVRRASGQGGEHGIRLLRQSRDALRAGQAVTGFEQGAAGSAGACGRRYACGAAEPGARTLPQCRHSGRRSGPGARVGRRPGAGSLRRLSAGGAGSARASWRCLKRQEWNPVLRERLESQRLRLASGRRLDALEVASDRAGVPHS